MSNSLRWSEQQLEAHLNRRENKLITSIVKQNVENGISVANQFKQGATRQTSIQRGSIILNCEIGLIPPSVNHYWLASGKRRYLSERARKFHEVVRQIVPSHQSTSRLKLNVTFHFPNKRCRDIDNYLKATIDSLVKCGLCKDDEQFDELLVKRGNVIKGGLIRLVVSEICNG